MKTAKEREELIKQLKKTPIVQIACERSGVSRATYYRWRKKNKTFKEQVDKALFEGRDLINEMAESQLIAGIRDQNMTAIIFWLKNNHRNYKNRVELSGSVSTSRELTKEEESLITQALIHAGMGNKLLHNSQQDGHTK